MGQERLAPDGDKGVPSPSLVPHFHLKRAFTELTFALAKNRPFTLLFVPVPPGGWHRLPIMMAW